MAQKTNSFERFWKELKRRKVVHVITVYAAVAFVIMQVVDMVAEPMRLPDSTKALVIVLLCIGFVIAVFLSWIYDITPAGVKKTKPASAVKHIDQTATPTSSGWKIATYVSGVIIVALVVFNFISRGNINADISKLEKSIAVLPFINDSPDTTNTYFINGIMERITTNLQMVKVLRVISRTSVEQYRNIKTKSIPEIAKELGVNYIIEGSGQKYGNSFSVTTQLIKAKGKETHLWARTYDQEIKEVNEYIRIQSQIAQTVATELRAIITPEEKQLIEKTPTASLTAYDFYQRGREELTKYWVNNDNRTALQKAEDLYNKALKYDSTFALAYTGLAWVYWNKSDVEEYFSKNYMDSVLILSDIALSFDNKLAEAYTLRGYYFMNRGIIDKAIDEFDKSLKINPNSWQGYAGKGIMYSNDEFVKAIDNYQKAVSLNHGFELPVLYRAISIQFGFAGFLEKARYYNLEAYKLDDDSVLYLSTLTIYEFDHNKVIELERKAYAIDSTNPNIAYL